MSASVAPPQDLLGRSPWAIAANSMTLGRIVLAPVLVLMILDRNPWWLSFALGWALGATDFIDGKLARHANPTRFGAFWDPLADKVVVLGAGFALVAIDRFGWIPWVLIAIREVGISLYRSYWARRSLAIPARTAAKYKTFIQGLALVAAMCPPLEPYPWVADSLLWLAVAFTLFTGLQYVMDGRDALRTTGTR